MNNYMAIYDQPWPTVEGRVVCKVIFQAVSIQRALELALERGQVTCIGVNSEVPIVVDHRAGATSVGGGQ